jgi:hypothetical protein
MARVVLLMHILEVNAQEHCTTLVYGIPHGAIHRERPHVQLGRLGFSM